MGGAILNTGILGWLEHSWRPLSDEEERELSREGVSPTEVGLDEVLDFWMAAETLWAASDDKLMRMLAGQMPIVIPQRLLRGGGLSLGAHILSRWPKKAVREKLLEGVRVVWRDVLAEARIHPEATLRRVMDEVGPPRARWVAREADVRDVLEQLWDDEAQQLLTTLVEVIGEHLRRVYRRHALARIRGAQPQVRMERLKREVRGLRKQAESSRDKLARATEHIRELKRTQGPSEDALTREALEALEQAAAELAREREEHAAALAELVREYERMLGEAKGTGQEKEEAPREDKLLLAGKTVGVLGGETREAAYRAVVEGLGGKFRFAPGIEKWRRAGCLAGCDFVLVITGYVKHKAVQRLERELPAGVPLVLVPGSGVAAFRRALLERGVGLPAPTSS